MKKNNGITLVALIITIIVMLILVSVTVSILINSNVIGTAKSAGERTKTAYNNESNFGESLTINVDGTIYNSIDEYLGATPGGENDTLTLTTPVETATESRASIVTVSIQGTPTIEEWLANISPQSRLTEMAVDMWGYEDWDEFVDGEGDEGETYEDIEEFYTKTGSDWDDYDDLYDFMVKTGLADTDQYNEECGATFTCNGQNVTAATAQFVFTKNNIEYQIVASKTTNGVTETGRTGTYTTSKCKVEEFTAIQTTKQTLTVDGYTVTVPAGFAYGKANTNVGKVTTGFVITDAVEQVGDTYYSTGNEFVWIPVNSSLQVGTPTKDKKMAKKIGDTDNYEGVLYDFSETGANTKSDEMTNYGVNTNSYREPATIGNTSSPYDINTLQSAYNTMIGKVKTAGGFYVGRYELGHGSNISKLGVTPANASESATNSWYGLYTQAKSYTHPNSTYAGTVTSQMIWGSQYDAMLNFALEDSNSKSKITDGSIGNHTGAPIKTGTHTGTDKILNIYDLEGNLFEWTAEADDVGSRVFRGGGYSTSNTFPASNRDGGLSPFDTYDSFSSRATLYVN